VGLKPWNMSRLFIPGASTGEKSEVLQNYRHHSFEREISDFHADGFMDDFLLTSKIAFNRKTF
jgi:hypothetical protein